MICLYYNDNESGNKFALYKFNLCSQYGVTEWTFHVMEMTFFTSYLCLDGISNNKHLICINIYNVLSNRY